MTDHTELDRLVAKLPRKRLDDPALLDEVGRHLDIVWPEEYVHVIADHNGVEGEMGEWWIVLTPVEDLWVANDDADLMENFPGLVIVGGDGGGEALAFDRATGKVLLVPWIGAEEDWLVLGANLTDALQRIERDEVFNAPHWAG